MNILICDDIKSEAARLEYILNSSGFDISAVSFSSGSGALEYIKSGASVDVCFLDIIMPEMSGAVLAEKLRKTGFAGEIIFLTNTNEYAAESYAVGAFSYLLKPPAPESVAAILSKLEKFRERVDTSGILIKSSYITKFLLYRDISHIEVIQHKVYFRLSDGEELETNATLSDTAAQLLCDGRFIQCHRSFIVNMDAISAIQGKNIIMRCGAYVPISKSYPEAKKEYMKWVFGGDRK